MDEGDPADLDNFWTSDDNIYPKNEKFPHQIEIALYPGHFLPVHNDDR